MTNLTDDTVTGYGEIDGYQPAPLVLYVSITDFGQASSHDAGTQGRYFDVGWWAPYFYVDLFTLGSERYQFEHRWIQYAFGMWVLDDFPGGLDGIHYDLKNGVECRIVLADS